MKYVGKGDHPEWILLCDSCEAGWHASCLRPALMVIPEGDWFCPDCNHKSLLTSLTEKLTELDVLLKKTEAERRRKERLAFINKGLSRALPSSPKKVVPKKESPRISSESSSSESDSEDEPMLLRRCRTQVNIIIMFNYKGLCYIYQFYIIDFKTSLLCLKYVWFNVANMKTV